MKIPEYATYKAKQKAFGEKCYRRITSTAEFDAWYEQESKLDTCVFRGVKEAKYKNFTSSQRKYYEIDRKDLSPQELVEIELNELRKTQGGLLQALCYSQGFPCSDLFLLSFAQHYGGITPLLDFTTNINKALFFMIWQAEQSPVGKDSDSLDNYGSLYLFPKKNMLTIEQLASSSAKVMKPFQELPFEHLQAQHVDSCLRLFSHKMFTHTWRARYVLIENKISEFKVGDKTLYTPLIISNINIISQDGCFVYSDKDLMPIEKGLGCLDIHKSLFYYIIKKYLAPNNITEENMFPQSEMMVEKALFNTLATPSKTNE